MKHTLKIYTEFFNSIVNGTKLFEIRKNDRIKKYAVDDTLVLEEYDPESDKFSGKQIQCNVSYVLNGGRFGIDEGYCVLGLCDVKVYDDFMEQIGYRKIGESTWTKP